MLVTCRRCGVSTTLNPDQTAVAEEIATFTAAHREHGTDLIVQLANSDSDDA